MIVPRTLERTARTFLARAVRGHDDEEQAFLPGEEIVEAENTFALGGAKLAETQEPAQSPVRCPIRRIGENVGRAVGEHETRADQQLRRRTALLQHFSCAFVGAYHAGERVPVGNADCGVTLQCRRKHEFSRMRGAAQEGEIRGDGDLGVGKRGRHAKSPCRYQEGRALSFPYSPSR